MHGAARGVNVHGSVPQVTWSAPAGTPYVGAAVAVGSTSVHFCVASVGGHVVTILADESVLLGLGGIVDRAGRLPDDQRQGLIDALLRYADAAAALRAADLTFVATEPLRRAADASDIQRAVDAATGRTLHVLSHEEEGLLSLIGATLGRRPDADILVVDIGGGSSEYVLAGPTRDPKAAGLPIGAARLTVDVVAHDPPTPSEIAELRAAAQRQLASAERAHPGAIVFVGGTASNLAKVVPSATVDHVLTRRRLAAAFRILGSHPAEATAARFGISRLRASILPAGAAIVGAFLDRYAVPQGQVSESSIREGTILAVARAGDRWRERLPELTRGWWD